MTGDNQERYYPGMRVFLDIGAHEGQTLTVVQDPRWRFDRIVCFEPAPACWTTLEELSTPVVEVCRFGLWHKDAILSLHNAGAVGASVSADKESGGATVECEFRDAAVWLRDNLCADDEVYAKINVEGAEAELVARMHETGTLSLIDHLLIHFDVRKVPSKKHLEGRIRDQLVAADIDFMPAHDIQFNGAHRGTIKWLQWVEGNRKTRDLQYRHLWRLEAWARRKLFPLKKLHRHR